jgi:hypothetical protein
MPSIDWPGIEHQLFFARRAYNPREGSAVNTFTAICSNEQGAFELEILKQDLLSITFREGDG